MKAYISGALTGVSNIEQMKWFYEQIAEICRDFGLEVYVPHFYSDPLKHPNITPSQVYEMDRKRVAESNLMVAYLGMPSLGTGSELEICQCEHVPVIVLFERGRTVSRMARGNPAIIEEIIFENYQDAYKQLREAVGLFVLESPE